MRRIIDSSKDNNQNDYTHTRENCIFKSDELLHEVLVTQANRMSITGIKIGLAHCKIGIVSELFLIVNTIYLISIQITISFFLVNSNFDPNLFVQDLSSSDRNNLNFGSNYIIFSGT
jgi:hypothetical protein